MQERSIKARCAAYLVDSNKTRDDVAKNLGISRRALQQKLDGDVEFKFSEAISLSRLFGCSVDDLAKSYLASK